MKIVNSHLAHSIQEQGLLKEPNAFGYVLVAAEIELPAFFSSNSDEKNALIAELKTLCCNLIDSSDVINRADVFDAFIIPPGTKEGKRLVQERNYDVHIATYDLVVLIECSNVDEAIRVRDSQELETILTLINTKSICTDVMSYKNAARIDDVSKDSDGIFLFNYFYSEDTQTLLDVWHYTAGWWTEKANLTNSTPLQPVLEGAKYNLINHCRWEKLLDVLPSLIFKPSMKNFVLKNFTENNIVAMPILYKLA